MWKDIPNYEGLYQASTLGNVRAYRRSGTRGHVLKTAIVKGYKRINLSKKNKRVAFSVHRLIAITFISNPQKLPQVNHKNGDKSDNRVSNLEWCDNKWNQLHANKILGKHTRGEKNGRAILTEKDVKLIRWLKHKSNIQAKDLATFYQVTDTTICDIWNFKKWKHI